MGYSWILPNSSFNFHDHKRQIYVLSPITQKNIYIKQGYHQEEAVHIMMMCSE